jgi:ribosomal protein L40E
MPFKHVDMESAMRRLAERRIEEAMREGKFDNLAGKGKPLDLEPMPADENARLMWWALRIMKNADYTPDEVRIRKQIEGLKDELPKAKTDVKVVALVTAINAAVRNLNTLGTNAINTPVAPVSLDVERKRFRERMAADVDPEVTPSGQMATVAGDVVCKQHRCRARNAVTAAFCRRCGAKLLMAT